MTYEASLATSRIIQRCESHDADVLNLRHEVSWPDGSRIGLHPVRQHGAQAVFLRAIHHDGHWLLLNLRLLAPALTAELPIAPLRDQPGTVMYTLRGKFHAAAGFLAAAQASALATWPGEPRAADPSPSRNGATSQQVAA